jgi:hypothetical protein
MKEPRVTKEDRIAKYLKAIPAAVAGADGHKQTFKVACSLYNGWALSEEETFAWLKIYNAKCEPPWSDKELEHKAKHAAQVTHEKPRGCLLGESRSTFEKAPPDWTLPTKPIGVWKVLTTLTTPNPISICTTANSTVKRVEIENTVVNVVKPGIPPLEGSGTGASGSKMETSSPPGVSISGFEPQRIAGELVKLQQAGAIKSEQDAEFFAAFISTFGATLAASTIFTHVAPRLSPEQLVPEPPPGLSKRELREFYEQDLEQVIGAEFIDRDYQPIVLRAPNSVRRKRRKTR